jgi:hypothetical protein
MADETLILDVKRFRTELEQFKSALRKAYPRGSQQVSSIKLRSTISALAEKWFSELSKRPGIRSCTEPKYFGNVNIHFQRVLLFAEKATLRSRYDVEIAAILHGYTADLLVPLMQGKNDGGSPTVISSTTSGRREAEGFIPTAFVGHSFAPEDKKIVACVVSALEAMGIKVITGKRPKADTISNKVKTMIESQHLFVGIFTRRDRLAGKKTWTTSTWVIEEKAYAAGKDRQIILLKEADVDYIGGIQGDYEYIEFSRETLEDALIPLFQLFNLAVSGLQ